MPVDAASDALSLATDPQPTEIYPLSLHDALPISIGPLIDGYRKAWREAGHPGDGEVMRSEEHTSELQSRQYLVCRLLLEKKKLNLSRHSKRQNGVTQTRSRWPDWHSCS